MIEIKNKNYKLCLIDTCVLSEIMKNKLTLGQKIVTKFLDENYIFCYTIQTIGELRKAKDIYDEFFEYLFPMLSFLMKNYNQLLEDEIQSYPNQNVKNPFLFFLNPLDKNNFNRKLKEFLDNPQMREFFINEEKDAPETLESLLQAVKDWPPDGEQYTKKEIEEWAENVVWKKIIETDRVFFNRQFMDLKHIIDYKKFQSWLMISYVSFYKFYINRARKAKVSDINDILITSCLPYMDAIICEKDLAEILRQLQTKHNFVKDLEIMKLNDFN